MAAKNTQQLIDDVTKRLAEVNSEIDALELVGPPTADLAAEEASALKRLARREALHRVSSALNAELAELRARLAAEKAAELAAKKAKAQAELDKARAEFANALYLAYDAAEELKKHGAEMDKVAPDFINLAGKLDQYAERIALILEDIGVVNVVLHDYGARRELRPVEN